MVCQEQLCGADVITFGPGLNGTIALTLGRLTISDTATITGNGAANTIIDAQSNSRIFDIAATVTLNGIALRNGRTFGTNSPSTATTFSGGAIRSFGILTINQCTVTGNSTSGTDAPGGAIYNSGDLFVNQSTISANTTSGNESHGGAIFSARGYVKVTDTTLSGNSVTGTAASGGAIYVLGDGVTIDRSTISGNTASQGGGGIFFVGTNVINFNRLTVMQSTISGNSSFGTGTTPFGGGGGIYGQFGEVFLLQSTVAANVSNHVYGGGGIYFDSSPAIIRNSIIARNIAAETGPDIHESPDLVDKFAIHSSLVGRHNGMRASLGQVPDINGNYIGGDTPATAINPLLSQLANNGGSTQTHALQPGSFAIDHCLNSWAVDPTQPGSVPFTSDQRGQPYTRILDSDGKGAAVIDIGAFESTGVRLLSPNPNSFTSRPTLQWSPVAGAVSYNIHVNNQSTGVAPYYTSTATGTSHTVNADFGIGEYRVWIQPVFATGPGNWSAPGDIFVLTSAEWQPMERVQLVPRPTFSWKTLPGAVKYDLWIDNFSTGQQQLVRQDVTGTSFTPAADLPMGLYRAWVRGIDAAGIHAAWSVLQEALVVPSVTPIGPLSGTFDRTPTFSWNSVTGAVNYELYVKSMITGVMVINGQSVATTNFTPVANLVDGTYRWWTIAVSPASIGPIKSGGSNPTDIYIGGRPTFITPAAGSSTSDRTPTFSWKPVDGAASYRLQVNRTDVAQNNVINQVGLTGTSFTPVANLAAGTYRAWVLAVSSTGELSPWSLEVNFTVTGTGSADDIQGFDFQLAGLLTSVLADEHNGRAEVPVNHAVGPFGDDLITAESNGKATVSKRVMIPRFRTADAVKMQWHLQLDFLMQEFATHEFAVSGWNVSSGISVEQ